MFASRLVRSSGCLDPFHIVRWATQALDVVRRWVWNTLRRMGLGDRAKQLKNCRYALWKFGRDQTDLGSPFRAEEIEELLESVLVVAGFGPHQPTGVVIDDDHQILVAAPVGDLVDPDPFEPVEGIGDLACVGDDAGGDRPDGAPGDPHQLDHRGLRRVGHEPRHLIVEIPGVTGAVTGPGHPCHRHSVVAAVHPWGICFDEHLRRARMEWPPPASSFAMVIATRAPSAAAATELRVLPGPARHDDRVVVDLNRGRSPPDGRHRSPAPIACGTACRSPRFADQPSNSEKAKQEAACATSPGQRAPTD